MGKSIKFVIPLDKLKTFAIIFPTALEKYMNVKLLSLVASGIVGFSTITPTASAWTNTHHHEKHHKEIEEKRERKHRKHHKKIIIHPLIVMREEPVNITNKLQNENENTVNNINALQNTFIPNIIVTTNVNQTNGSNTATQNQNDNNNNTNNINITNNNDAHAEIHRN